MRGFLNSVIQANDIVHDGIMYGTIAKFEMNFLPGRSVLTTSHARIPPISMASIDMLIDIINVFMNGLKKNAPAEEPVNVFFQ